MHLYFPTPDQTLRNIGLRNSVRTACVRESQSTGLLRLQAGAMRRNDDNDDL